MLTREFRRVAGQIALIIASERSLPPADKTFQPLPAGSHGIAGGEKYVVPGGPTTRGIFFKFAVDTIGLYGGDAQAAKAAKHELTSAQAIAGAAAAAAAAGRRGGAAPLGIPLVATVDVLGYRLLAISVLPVGGHTLAYGSANAGGTVLASAPDLVSAFQASCRALNVAPQNVTAPAPAWAPELRRRIMPHVIVAAGGLGAAGLHEGDDGGDPGASGPPLLALAAEGAGVDALSAYSDPYAERHRAAALAEPYFAQPVEEDGAARRGPRVPTSRLLWGPMDLEGHVSGGGAAPRRLHALDAARLMPPEPHGAEARARTVLLGIPCDARSPCREEWVERAVGGDVAWPREASELLRDIMARAGLSAPPGPAGEGAFGRVPTPHGVLMAMQGALSAGGVPLASSGVRPSAEPPTQDDLDYVVARAAAIDEEAGGARGGGARAARSAAWPGSGGAGATRPAQAEAVAETEATCAHALVTRTGGDGAPAGSSVLPLLPPGVLVCSLQERQASALAAAPVLGAAPRPHGGGDSAEVNARASRVAGRVVLGDCVLVVGLGWGLTRLLRPEAVAASPLPLSSEAFAPFGSCRSCAPATVVGTGRGRDGGERPLCGHDSPRMEARSRAVAEHVARVAVPALAAEMDAGRVVLTDPSGLPSALHAAGINLRAMGRVRAAVRSPSTRALVLTEALARVLRRVLHARLRAASSGPGDPVRALAAFLSLAFGSSPASSAFWRSTVPAALDAKMGLDVLLAADELETVRGRGLRALQGADPIPVLARLSAIGGFAMDGEDVDRVVLYPAVLQRPHPFVAGSPEEAMAAEGADDPAWNEDEDEDEDWRSEGGGRHGRDRRAAATVPARPAAGPAAPAAAAGPSARDLRPITTLRLTGRTRSIFDEAELAEALEATICGAAPEAAGAGQAAGAAPPADPAVGLSRLVDVIGETIGVSSAEHVRAATRHAQALRRSGLPGIAASVATAAAERAPPMAGLLRALALTVAAEALEATRDGPASAVRVYERARRIASVFAPAHPLVARLSCSLARCGLASRTEAGRSLAIRHMAAGFAIYDSVYGSSGAMELIVPAIVSGRAEEVGSSMGELCLVAMEAAGMREEGGRAAAWPGDDDPEGDDGEEAWGAGEGEDEPAASGAGGGGPGAAGGGGAGARRVVAGAGLLALGDREVMNEGLALLEREGRQSAGETAEASARMFRDALRLSSVPGPGVAGGGAAGAGAEPGEDVGTSARRIVGRLAASLAAVEDMMGYSRGHFIGRQAAGAAANDGEEAAGAAVGGRLLRQTSSTGSAGLGTAASGIAASLLASSAASGSEVDHGAEAALPDATPDGFPVAKWVVGGPGCLSATAGVPTYVTVTALGADGAAVPIPLREEVSAVLEGPGRHLATASLGRSPSERRLWFLPVVAGAYAVILTLAGEPVAVSPRPVRVVAGPPDRGSVTILPLGGATQGAPLSVALLVRDLSGNAVAAPGLSLWLSSTEGSHHRREEAAWTPVPGSDDGSCGRTDLREALDGPGGHRWSGVAAVPEMPCSRMERLEGVVPLAGLSQCVPSSWCVTTELKGASGLVMLGPRGLATSIKPNGALVPVATVTPGSAGAMLLHCDVAGKTAFVRRTVQVEPPAGGSGRCGTRVFGAMPSSAGKLCNQCQRRIAGSCLKCSRRVMGRQSAAVVCQLCTIRSPNRCCGCRAFVPPMMSSVAIICHMCASHGVAECVSLV